MERPKVFLAGVFDMLHIGHVRLLRKAAALGRVTVGLVCDEAVKAHKGDARPIIPYAERYEILSSIYYVDSIIELNKFRFPEEVIYDDGYSFVLVGADQDHFENIDDIPWYLRYDMPRTKGVSTSDIIKRLAENE